MAHMLRRVKGDSDPVEATLLQNGQPFDISAAISVALHVRAHGGAPVVTGLAGTIVDDGTEPLRGKLSYDATDASATTAIEALPAGEYDVQQVVGWPDGTERRWPNDGLHLKAWLIYEALD